MYIQCIVNNENSFNYIFGPMCIYFEYIIFILDLINFMKKKGKMNYNFYC